MIYHRLRLTLLQTPQPVQPQSLIRNPTGASKDRICSPGRFREGDDVPNRFGVANDRHEAIETQCDTSVRGCAVFESLQKMIERLDLGLSQLRGSEKLVSPTKIGARLAS